MAVTSPRESTQLGIDLLDRYACPLTPIASITVRDAAWIKWPAWLGCFSISIIDLTDVRYQSLNVSLCEDDFRRGFIASQTANCSRTRNASRIR